MQLRNSLIAIAFLFLNAIGYSQTYFHKYDHTSTYTRTQSCEVVGNHVFYSRSHHKDFTQNRDFEHWLIKADDQLNRLDSVDLRALLNLPVHKTLSLVYLKEDKGDIEISLQALDTTFYCGYFQSYILRFNTNLNLLDSNKFGTANHTFRVANTFDLNNKRLAAGYSQICTNGNWGTLSQGIADLDLPNTYQSLTQIPNGNPIELFHKVNDTTFVYSFRVYNQVSNWVMLNEKWEMKDYGYLRDPSIFPGLPATIHPYKFITSPDKLPIPLSIGYSYANGTPHWNIYIAQIDTLNNETASDTLPVGGTSLSLDSNGFFNIIPSIDMLDQRNLDSVFFAINKIKMTQDSFIAKVIQPMYFYSYNANNMVLNEIKVDTPDYPRDHNFSISSFQDGRILLGFNEYNWDKFGNNTMAIHWMIVPKNGYLNNNHVPHHLSALNVFPNPSKGLIQIENIPEEWDIINYALYDLMGRKVSNGNLSKSQSDIDFSSLEIKNGLYLLKLENSAKKEARIFKILYEK